MSTSTVHRFGWDFDVPNDDFWPPLGFKVSRNFLQQFPDDEINQMKPQFDPKLSQPQKLELLLKLLEDALSSREAILAPKTLYEVDYSSWLGLQVGMETIENELGRTDAREKRLRMLIATGRNGNEFSQMHTLAWLMEDKGNYAEGEEMERKVLPFFDAHERLGVDSPQSLSARRLMIRLIWKQGRIEEAKGWVTETGSLIEAMGPSKFGKYQADEKEMLVDLVKELEGWKAG